MDIRLYKKYGNYGDRGLFILDHNKYDYYQKHLEERRWMTIKAKLWLLVPFIGMIVTDLYYAEMGEDCFT